MSANAVAVKVFVTEPILKERCCSVSTGYRRAPVTGASRSVNFLHAAIDDADHDAGARRSGDASVESRL